MLKRLKKRDKKVEKPIIEYKVLKINYNIFYSYKVVANKVNSFDRTEILDKNNDVIMGFIHDPETIDVFSLSN